MSRKSNVPDCAKAIPPQLEPQLGYQPFKESRWATLVHRWRGDKLVFDFWRSSLTNKMRVVHEWKRANESQLYIAGYKQAIDLVGGWEYMGMKVYARLHNFKMCDAKLQGIEETSSTLFDYSVSRAGRDFLNGFVGKIHLSEMDTKKLTSIAVIIAGAAIGAYILFFM